MSSTFIPDPSDDSAMNGSDIVWDEAPQPSDFNASTVDPTAPSAVEMGQASNINPTAEQEAAKKARWDEMQQLIKDSREKTDYWFSMRWLAAFLSIIPFFGVFGDLTI